MTKDEFEKLERGDIIRHVNSSEAYVVDGTIRIGNSTFHIIVRTKVISNPEEWTLFKEEP